mgnify:CR=1 FL=1
MLDDGEHLPAAHRLAAGLSQCAHRLAAGEFMQHQAVDLQQVGVADVGLGRRSLGLGQPLQVQVLRRPVGRAGRDAEGGIGGLGTTGPRRTSSSS